MSAVHKSTLIGAVLGNYRLTAEISSGGMGTVYRAVHEILGRPAAVKLLRPELSANEEAVDRFFNEAKAATAIRHPGIIEVYDFGYTEDGHAYLVMELLEGKVLSRAIEDVGRFTELEAAGIAKGIASALKAAHAQGIVHRDLKPDNVFLVPDLEGSTGATRAKVLDFGIAKLTTTDVRRTQTDVLIGTPLYMAPEQARQASAIDHRADLYSLGCILYELLVGSPPFVSQGAGEVIALHLFAEPEPPRARIPELSPEIDAIVMKLLAKEPHDRYQSAGELYAALLGVNARLSGELAALLPVSGPRPMPVLSVSTIKRPVELQTEASPAPRRSAMPIIAGGITLAIAAAIVVFAIVRRGDDVEAKRPDPTPTPPTPVAAPKPEPPSVVDHTPVADQPAIVDKTPDPEPAIVDNKQKPTPKPVIKRPATVIKKPPGPQTGNGSPIETDLDGPKKPKS